MDQVPGNGVPVDQFATPGIEFDQEGKGYDDQARTGGCIAISACKTMRNFGAICAHLYNSLNFSQADNRIVNQATNHHNNL